MIGMRARAEWNGPKLRRAAQQADFKSLGHAAAALRMAARRSIRRRKKPSRIGEPVSTHSGAAKNAFAYDVTRPDGPAVIGPMASRIGPAMSFHEFGGRRGNRFLPRRPVIGPALAKIGPRMAKFWSGSVRRS